MTRYSLVLTGFLLAAPCPALADAASVEIEVQGAQAMAHKTVQTDGSMTGGHLAGLPPRLYRDSGQMEPQALERLLALLADLPPCEASPRTAPPLRRLVVVDQSGSRCPFTTAGDPPFAHPGLENAFHLIAQQRVGGW